MTEITDQDPCPNCGGGLEWLRQEDSDRGCSCHICPPCSYCMETELRCTDCGEVAVEYEPPVYVPPTPEEEARWAEERRLYQENLYRWRDAGDGREIQCLYRPNMSSNASMCFEGKFRGGKMTSTDIKNYIGAGTFGERFDEYHYDEKTQTGRFIYKQWTD